MINTDRKDKGTNVWIFCRSCGYHCWADMCFIENREHVCMMCGVRRLMQDEDPEREVRAAVRSYEVARMCSATNSLPTTDREYWRAAAEAAMAQVILLSNGLPSKDEIRSKLESAGFTVRDKNNG